MSTHQRIPSLRTSLVAVGLGLTLVSTNIHAAAKIGLKFSGEYIAGNKYARGDAVTWEGTLYQAVKGAQRGKVPNQNPEIWRVVLPGYVGAGGSNDCGSPGPGNNLAGCRFDDTNDANVNPLKDKNLKGANLTGAVLVGDLGVIDLTGAKLTGASLGEVSNGGEVHPVTIAPGSFLSYADLSGLPSIPAPLQASGDAQTGTSVDFTGATIVFATLQSARLQNATFDFARLDGTSFGGADMSHARFAFTSLRGTDLSSTNLSGAVFGGVDLTGLGNGSLSDVDLTGAQISRTKFRDLLLTNVNLTGAYLGFCDFTGVKSGIEGTPAVTVSADTVYESTICPDGFIADNVAASTTCVGHGF